VILTKLSICRIKPGLLLSSTTLFQKRKQMRFVCFYNALKTFFYLHIISKTIDILAGIKEQFSAEYQRFKSILSPFKP